jgi:acryloyl-coenzyme A reductase
VLALDPGLPSVKALQVRGSAHATRPDLEEVVNLVSEGRIEPLTQTWSLDDVGEAHRALEARSVADRVMVVP